MRSSSVVNVLLVSKAVLTTESPVEPKTERQESEIRCWALGIIQYQTTISQNHIRTTAKTGLSVVILYEIVSP